MTVLAVAMGSAIVIATKAIPDGKSPADAARSAASAARQLAAELHYAKSVSENTATALTFTVADRTGDGNAETIRYAWSGAAGAPLTRQFNGGEVETILHDVHECRLDYVRNPVVATATTTAEVTSDPPILLASFNTYPSGTVTEKPYSVSSTQWLSERFYLDTTQLPADVKRVNFTEAFVWMQGNGSTAPPAVLELRTAVGGGNPLPSATVIGSSTIVAAAMPTTLGWVRVPLANPALSDVNQDLCLLLRGSSSSNSLTVGYKYHSKGINDKPMLLTSSDGGGSWLPTTSTDRNKQDLRFYLYGTYTTSATTQVQTTSYYLLSADLRLRAGSDPAGTVVTAVPVLEHPLVTGP